MIEELKDRVLVVDDFCEFADGVVQSFKDAGMGTWRPNKGRVGTSIYDGIGFWGDHALMLRAIVGSTGKVIVPNSMFFRLTSLDTEEAYVHSDRSSGDHTCVAYLSEHEDTYGTAFYRHKATGMLEMPSFEDMAKMGIEAQMTHDMAARDSDDWEQVGFVEGKYNRAVIFDAPLFHSRVPLTGFGNTEEAGRLVWVSHYFNLDSHGDLS